jgi:molecular chaperone DnaK
VAIIGIDLGTSNSAAAVLRDGRPVIIPSAEGVTLGGKAFPSYVAFTESGQLLVGEPARRQAATNPEGTTTGFKRLMGTRQRLTLRGKEFSPEQLSAFLLQKIKRDAESFIGATVDKAVVTVPAYFDDNQRTATKDACAIAGIDAVRLVNEPTAAALAFGLDRLGQEARIAVVDFGGGTLDVTILELGAGVFEVKATSGDTKLGGRDMDERIVEWLLQRLEERTKVDARHDRMAMIRLREAAEFAKIELSTSTSARISLPFLTRSEAEPVHFDLEMTRTDLERLIGPVLERCRGPVEQALRDFGKPTSSLDKVVFVGGPTRMPAVRDLFEQVLGRQAERGIDPMEAVACGAAVQAGVLGGELRDIVLVDVTPLTLGIETLGGVATSLIDRNTPIPIKKSEVFTTAADRQTAVTVHVLQGERPLAADNVSLGTFNLEGLPPAPRGIPKIEVTFDIDASGLLEVSARELVTGRSQSIRISGSTHLAKEDKERMVREAEKWAESDRKRRDEVDQLNAADALAYQTERFLADYGAKLETDLRGRLEAALADLRVPLAGRDTLKLTDAKRKLETVLDEAGRSIYAERPPESGTRTSGATPGTGGEHVVDAEYRRGA